MSEEDLSNKLVISAALTGAATNRAQNPNIPFTADEFGDEVKKCYTNPIWITNEKASLKIF